jgi:hypothetical protein
MKRESFQNATRRWGRAVSSAGPNLRPILYWSAWWRGCSLPRHGHRNQGIEAVPTACFRRRRCGRRSGPGCSGRAGGIPFAAPGANPSRQDESKHRLRRRPELVTTGRLGGVDVLLLGTGHRNQGSIRYRPPISGDGGCGAPVRPGLSGGAGRIPFAAPEQIPAIRTSSNIASAAARSSPGLVGLAARVFLRPGAGHRNQRIEPALFRSGAAGPPVTRLSLRLRTIPA